MIDLAKRYDVALTGRIEEVVHARWTYVAWWELYLWYARDRINERIWKDILERFIEAGGSPDDLSIREDKHGFHLACDMRPFSEKTAD